MMNNRWFYRGIFLLSRIRYLLQMKQILDYMESRRIPENISFPVHGQEGIHYQILVASDPEKFLRNRAILLRWQRSHASRATIHHWLYSHLRFPDSLNTLYEICQTLLSSSRVFAVFLVHDTSLPVNAFLALSLMHSRCIHVFLNQDWVYGVPGSSIWFRGSLEGFLRFIL